MSRRRRGPKVAMVLAAGFGKRMRPITETLPKPLVQVNGEAMLDRILDRLVEAGVKTAVVNLHHLGAVIESHLAERTAPEVVFSPEAEILETGGGVKKALSHLGKEPFFVVNGDVLWVDGRSAALRRLAESWDGRKMDCLLLLHQCVFAYGYDGMGDFFLNPAGVVRRRREREVAPFVFGGMQIIDPKLFDAMPEGPFSLNRIYDLAAERGRLHGICHDGEWFHVGTPEDLKFAEDAMHRMSVPAIHR